MLPAADLLAALTDLVLHRSDPAPTLVGVNTLRPTLRLHVVPLDAADPVADLGLLSIPPEWDVVIVGCAARAHLPDGTRLDVEIAHGRNRAGDEATRSRSTAGTTTLHFPLGRLQRSCEQLLAEVAPRRSMGEQRS